MLKALELAGFKSFADRSRFELPPGITVIVGPNGSGKSNIVDAIKWVLGEQSAKSLRGKEMADVIFKGSGTSGRKPMNAAEATLIFENADGKLPIDAPEVHVTRRVFRSGEGEYLINRQPARLKDIRDMFRGTGVGVDAYSLIEQGKVDRLLQASARDRRAIFEEAAGISRFKAKKVEAQRRLERVEQNLLRLSDIVEEVENRLKTVRAQAGKARRYREYSERLQALRTQIARVDWRRLTEKLSGIESELAALAEQIHSADAEAQRLEANQLELETAVATAAEELHNCENRLGFARQQISQVTSTIEHERSRLVELDDEAQRERRNLLAMSDRAGDLRSRLAATQAEVHTAQQALSTAAEEVSRRESQLAELVRQHQETRQQAESRRKQYVAQLQAAAALASQVEAGESQLAGVQESMLKLQQQLTEATAGESQVADELAAAQAHEQSLADRAAAHQHELEAAQNDLAENRNLHASRAEDLAQLHSRRQGVAERHDVLEEFERTLEGIGAGVKQLLNRAGRRGQRTGDRRQETDDLRHGSALPPISETQSTTSAPHPWSCVRGVVADFLQVGVEHAPAIDAALGDAAGYVVVDTQPDQVRELIAHCADLTGRVVLLASTQRGTRSAELAADDVIDIRVIARADKLVECSHEFRPLVSLLLDATFVVETLDDALKLRHRAPPGTRLVTLAGELVDELGAVHFGPRQSATSLVSRRSQLRAARLDLAVLDQQIIDSQRETLHLKREIERHEGSVRQLQETGKVISLEAAAQHAKVETLSQQAGQVGQRKQLTQSSLAASSQRCQAIEAALRQASQQLADAQEAADRTQAVIGRDEDTLSRLDRDRQDIAEQVTGARSSWPVASSGWRACGCD